MRRVPVSLLAGVGLALLLAIAVVFHAPCSRRGGASVTRVPLEVVHRVALHVGRELALSEAGVSAAWGADSLHWQPVTQGSSSLERRRNRRVVVAAPEAPEATDTPEPPAVDEPVVPDVPEPPDVIVSKSGSITRIGSDVHVEKDQVVAGDLVALGGDVTVDGHIEGDLVAMGGDVKLSATARVDGDVATIGGRLTEDTGAVVGGQRVSAAGLRGGRHIRHEDDGEERTEHRGGHVTASLVFMSFMLLLAWGFTSIAPGRTAGALATLRREPGLSFGLGALIWALVVPSIVALALVVAILCITIIGIPLAIAALFGYFLFIGLLVVWGFVVGMAGVGSWFTERRRANAPAAYSHMTAAPPPSLTRLAITGVLLIAGAGLVGEMMKSMGPLRGLGIFLAVMSIIALSFAATFGAGAWLRTEIVSDTLGRWWRGRRRPGPGTIPPAPGDPSPNWGQTPTPSGDPTAGPVSEPPAPPSAPDATGNPNPPVMPPPTPEDPARYQPPGSPAS